MTAVLSIYQAIQNLFDQMSPNIDAYKAAEEIIRNYNHYGYSNQESAYYHMLIGFQIYFQIQLDPQRLLDVCRTTRSLLNRDQSDHFVQEVKRRFQRCLLSGFDATQCEVAHIRPLTKEYNFDPDNGLLLSADLHRLFDQLWWSINPDTLTVEVSPNQCQLSINQYGGQQLDSQLFNPTSRQLLREHYQTFVDQRSKNLN